MPNYTLTILAIERETDDTVTVYFKQPSLKKIKYLPGQYLTLIFRIKGRRYIRPYSFSSTPLLDNTLNITVKRMFRGIVSNHIIDHVKVGDLIEVMEPLGDFTLPEQSFLIDKHLFFWGSGSGITPLFSMIKYILHSHSDVRITLVYGNRNPETTIFFSQIEELQRRYAQKFFVFNFYSRTISDVFNDYILKGRIAPEKVLTTLKSEIAWPETIHYICGPFALKELVKNTLRSEGVPNDNIFTEDFEIIRNPKDFENITTRQVSVTRMGRQCSFEVIKGKSILEGGLDAMLELDYSCQTGDCLLCKGKLLKGEVKMVGNDNGKLQVGECLLCCSFPLTDNIEIIIT